MRRPNLLVLAFVVIVGLQLIVIALQLRLLDATTKARDTTEEIAYQVSGLDSRSNPDGTRAARRPVRSFWRRLTDDEDDDR